MAKKLKTCGDHGEAWRRAQASWGSNGPFKEHAELPRDLAVHCGAKKAAREAPQSASETIIHQPRTGV
jgi:hypothetical protein